MERPHNPELEEEFYDIVNKDVELYYMLEDIDDIDYASRCFYESIGQLNAYLEAYLSMPGPEQRSALMEALEEGKTAFALYMGTLLYQTTNIEDCTKLIFNTLVNIDVERINLINNSLQKNAVNHADRLELFDKLTYEVIDNQAQSTRELCAIAEDLFNSMFISDIQDVSQVLRAMYQR